VTGAGFAQTLVLGGLAQPEATRKQQQQAAAQVGMKVSAQGLEQRFSPAAVEFMRQLLETGMALMVSAEQARTLLPQFNGVYVDDCSRLEWSRLGVKLAVRWELQSGQLQASLGALQQHDQKTALIERDLPAGALHLGDLGFFKLNRFAHWNKQGVYWLTRFKVGTLVYTPEGQALDLLAAFTTADPALSIPVRIGAGAQLPAYLLAARLPDDAYAKRLARLQEEARLDQRPLSERQLAFAAWTLYLTNIPHLSFDQAHTLARTRWQIELLFKLWKSHGKVLTSRSADPLRQQCEGYGKLLGVLIAHWLLLVTGWQYETLGALDALRTVKNHIPLLMRALSHPSLWRLLFAWLQHDLCNVQRRSKRRKVPLAFQLWQAFDLVFP
jgi:Transposase DDE domain